MDFKTYYSERKPIYSNPGTDIKIEYGAKLDRYGNRIIEPRGEINFKAFINSHAKAVDLNLLLAKFVAGDTTALTQRVAQYIDVSAIPDNINDFLNIKTQAEKLFDTLPVKVKSAFGNNVNNFLSNYGTKEWMEVMNGSENDLRRAEVKDAVNATKIHAANVHSGSENNGSESAAAASGQDSSVIEQAKNLVYGAQTLSGLKGVNDEQKR